MYTTTLLKKETIAEGTDFFHFEKPEGFTFLAGQSMDLTLINPGETDAEGNSRTFSIVTPPSDSTLAIATRMRDTAFKNTVRDMPIGTQLSLDGPFGSFTLHENAARTAVFLSGGIGITPFHSMITDALARELPHTIVLFYSNRRPEDAAFLSELQTLSESVPTFTLVATMTNMEDSQDEWTGEQGYIDAPMLERHLSRESSPIYYVAGPQKMVTAMRTMLTESGVSADDIRFEEFAGY